MKVCSSCRWPPPAFKRHGERCQQQGAFKAIGSAVIDITPGTRFGLIARQTSASIKNIAAHALI
jgi:hypothetical protein